MNLTGDNIQTVLDNMLYRALFPIVCNTNVFDTQIQHVLARITINKKRKLVSIERDKAISLLSKALIEENKLVKFNLIEQSKIERSIIHRFIGNVLMDIEQYYSLYIQNRIKPNKIHEAKLKAFCRNFGAKSYDDLFVIRNQVNDFISEYYKYRNSIVDHYVKFSHKSSNNFRQTKNNNYDSNDVFQNFLSAVTKAIDKYDSSKGALTSYINYWILNAKTCNSSSSEYGIAYTIPHSKKKEKVTNKDNVNFSMSLESEEINTIDYDNDVHTSTEKEEENKIVQFLIKRVDKKGCLRLTLDIDEYFSNAEYELMRKNLA